MADTLESRIIQNHPDPGWYWEIVSEREVIARGFADTHKQAASQVAAVERATEPERKKGAQFAGAHLGAHPDPGRVIY